MGRVKLAVMLLGGLVLAAPLLVATSAVQEKELVTKCVNNLAQLYKMQRNYMIQYGGANRDMPTDTGTKFWLALTRTKPPLIDSAGRDILQCPIQNRDEGAGSCDYRGPVANVNSSAVGDGEAIGADKLGNHGTGKGGNILRKSGDVLTVTADDPLWKAAASSTKGDDGDDEALGQQPGLVERIAQLERDVRNLKQMMLFSFYICTDTDFPQQVGYPWEDHWPYLGIGYEYLAKETSEALGLKEGEGVKVLRVEAGSPAANAGIREGDVLLTIGGRPVKRAGLVGRKKAGTGWEDRAGTPNWVTTLLPGESSEFVYSRKGVRVKVTVTTTCKKCGTGCFFRP